jgi:hypothetical protein
VVEACLAVRPHECSTAWRFKPLIVEAMRDLVPAAVLQRTTKGDFSADGHTSLRHDGSVAMTQPQSVKRGGGRPLRQRPAAPHQPPTTR